MIESKKIKILTQYGKIKHKIELLNTKIELLQSSMLPAGMKMEDVKAHVDGYSLEDYVVDLEKYENEKEKLESKLEKSKARICNEAMKLENQFELKIIIMRYIDLSTWENISTTLNYSRAHTLRLHRDALNKMFESRKEIK